MAETKKVEKPEVKVKPETKVKSEVKVKPEVKKPVAKSKVEPKVEKPTPAKKPEVKKENTEKTESPEKSESTKLGKVRYMEITEEFDFRKEIGDEELVKAWIDVKMDGAVHCSRGYQPQDLYEVGDRLTINREFDELEAIIEKLGGKVNAVRK